MNASRQVVIGLTVSLGLIVGPGVALGDPTEMTLLEQLNAHAMLETLANGYFMIQQEFGLDPASTVSWTGTYAETGWTGAITGTLYRESVVVDYTGTSTLEANGDLRLAYSAGGAIGGTQTITVNGTGLWTFDPSTGRYVSLYLEDQGVVDTPKLKWWHKALEAVGGGILGGLAAGAGGVLVGANAGVALSEAIWESTTDGGDPPAPGTPTAPVVLDWNQTLTQPAGPDEIISRIYGPDFFGTGTGELGADIRSLVSLDGTWNGGVAGGTGATVPEPVTFSLLASGALGLILRGKRRRRA